MKRPATPARTRISRSRRPPPNPEQHVLRVTVSYAKENDPLARQQLVKLLSELIQIHCR